MVRRFSSRTLTGIRRFEVAVGTVRLASMFSTILSAPPRIGTAFSALSVGAGFASAEGGDGATASGAGAAPLAVAVVALGGAAAPLPPPCDDVADGALSCVWAAGPS